MASALNRSETLSVLLIVATWALYSPSAALAQATVVVTTTADVVDGTDGLISVREAIDIANTNGVNTTVVLADDLVYQLTRCVVKEPIDLGNGIFIPPQDDDANLDGDLDHTAAEDLTIQGNGSTIENTCLYDRVLQNLQEDSWLTLEDLTIAGGRSAPGFGNNLYAPGGAALVRVVVTDSRRDLGAQAAAVVVGPDSFAIQLALRLSMLESTIIDNEPGGVRVNNGNGEVIDSGFFANDGAGLEITSGQLTVSGSEFVDNTGRGVSGVDGSVTVTDSSAVNNGGIGFRNTGNVAMGQPLNLTRVSAVNNAGGGAVCSFCSGLVIEDSTICSNGGTGVSMIANLVGPTMVIRNTLISQNEATLGGGGIDMQAISGQTPVVTIERSTIASNVAAPGVSGGGIRLDSAGLNLTNSTVTLNQAPGMGGGVATVGAETVTLSYVTLVENSAGSGGQNLHRDTGDLAATASVIALPGGGDNCSSAGGSVLSGGFNQCDDTSCGLTAASDLAPAGDPLLGPLADNGGPTPTRLPASGSPLLDTVVGPLCGGTDQRGVARPQGPACDVGSVERKADHAATAGLLVGRTPLSSADQVIRDWLEGRGYEVVLIDDDALPDDELETLDLLYVSASVVSWKVGGALNELPVPILNSEGYLSDDLGMALLSGETLLPTRFVNVVDGASGLLGVTQVLRAPRQLAFGIPGSAAHVIARTLLTVPVVFAYDAGDELADGSNAAGARAAFFFTETAPLSANSAAFELLDYTLDRLLGAPNP